MTNAAVDTTVSGVDGQVVTVKYKDGEKKVVIPPNTPIVAYAPGDKAEIKPGAQIIIMGAQKQPDGSLRAPAINVGRRRHAADVSGRMVAVVSAERGRRPPR